MLTSTLLQQWFEEVWDNANENFIDEGMDNDVIVHGLDPVGITQGIDNFKLFYKNFRETFPTVKVKVELLVHDVQFASAYCQVMATSKDGKEIMFAGISVVKYRNRKIVEGWNNFDFLRMYQQLGHILIPASEV